MPVQVGSPAPSFQARAYVGFVDEFREITLDGYTGQWLCLFFYPLDFSSVCATEIAAFNRALGEFDARDCAVLGCSTDSAYSHKAFSDTHQELGKPRYPLLADMTRRISMDYGVLLAEQGVALRGTFLMDPHAVVRWQAVYDLPVERSVREVLRVLDALQSGEPCPCEQLGGVEAI